MLVVSLYEYQPIDCDFIYWTNMTAQPEHLTQFVIGKFNSIQNNPILDICHIPITGNWCFQTAKIAARHTTLIVDFKIKTEQDLDTLLNYKFLQLYGIYICIDYCSPHLKHDCLNVLNTFDLVYLRKAHVNYLTDQPLDISCKCFTYIRQGMYKDSYQYCDDKTSHMSYERMVDIPECDKCKYICGYEVNCIVNGEFV